MFFLNMTWAFKKMDYSMCAIWCGKLIKSKSFQRQLYMTFVDFHQQFHISNSNLEHGLKRFLA